MHWSQRYVGIPFRWNGYTRDGASCWGLCWMVMREQFGISIERHEGGHRRVAGASEDYQTYAAPFVPLLRPKVWREGDLLHMMGRFRGRTLPIHVGVLLDRRRVLHTTPETGAAVIDITRADQRWRPIMGYRCAT